MIKSHDTRPRELVFLLGIRSNFYRLMPEALNKAHERGYQTTILDVVELVKGWRRYPNDWATIELDQRVTKPGSIFELLQFCLAHRNTKPVVIFLYLPDRNIRFIWRLFQLFGYRVGAMVSGPVPRGSVAGSERRGQMSFTKLALRIKRYLKPRPDFWITAGAACDELYASYFRTLRRVPRIHAHSIDYEHFRAKGPSETRNVETRATIAVLDQGWFTKPRPDCLSELEYPPASESVFGPAIRRFLAMLETTFNWRATVLCHPKADYNATVRLYEGFEVLRSSTPQVVANSKLVLANSTTALQFAVLQKKPVCLFTSNELNRSVARELQEGYRNELQCPVVNIDEVSHDGVSALKFDVNEQAYDRFIDRYVKHADSPEEPLWDIVLDGIET